MSVALFFNTNFDCKDVNWLKKKGPLTDMTAVELHFFSRVIVKTLKLLTHVLCERF